MRVEFHYDKKTTDKIAEFQGVLEEYTASLFATLQGLQADYMGTELRLSNTEINRIVVNDATRCNILEQIAKVYALSFPTRIELIKDDE